MGGLATLRGYLHGQYSLSLLRNLRECSLLIYRFACKIRARNDKINNAFCQQLRRTIFRAEPVFSQTGAAPFDGRSPATGVPIARLMREASRQRSPSTQTR